jgi:hypothetical protein
MMSVSVPIEIGTELISLLNLMESIEVANNCKLSEYRLYLLM